MIPGDTVYLNKDKQPFKKDSQGTVTEVLPSGLIVLDMSKDENCRSTKGILFAHKKDLIKGARCR